MANTEGANCVLTLVTLIFIFVDCSLHPMVRWNWVINAIDNICEITKTKLIRLTIMFFVFWVFTFKLIYGPVRECDHRSARIWSHQAFFVFTKPSAFTIDFDVIKLNREKKLVKNWMYVQCTSAVIVAWVNKFFVVASKHDLRFFFFRIERHEERKDITFEDSSFNHLIKEWNNSLCSKLGIRQANNSIESFLEACLLVNQSKSVLR